MVAALVQTYEIAPIGALHPHPENARRGNLAEIGKSIDANGFYGAVLAQRSTSRILAGHHRWYAAKAAGLATVPVVWVDVDDDHARRILLADNRTNDVSTYDEEALLALLDEVALAPGSLAGTGFEERHLDDLRMRLGGEAEAETLPPERPDRDYADRVPPPAAARPGEVAPSKAALGLREMVLVYTNEQHAQVTRMVDELRGGVPGNDAPTTSDVVYHALYLALSADD